MQTSQAAGERSSRVRGTRAQVPQQEDVLKRWAYVTGDSLEPCEISFLKRLPVISLIHKENSARRLACLVECDAH